MAVPVRVAVDGDRAYFGVWDASGTARRLQRTDWVQVVRSTPLGMASFGPRINATAQLLDGEEAGQAAERLARARPAWQKSARSLADWVTRRQTAYYELQPDEFAKAPAPPPPAVTRVVRTRTARRGQQLPPVPLR